MDNDLQVVEPVDNENMAHPYTSWVDVDLDMQPSISGFDIISYHIILYIESYE